MDWLAAPDYWLARLIVQRGLAAIYLVAFLVTLNQFRPLLGEQGLRSTTRFVERTSFRETPSLFHLVGYTDRRLALVAWAGIVLSVLALAGVSEQGPVWVSMLVWLALWALYLSIVNVGQIFYAFGWESILCEAGFFAVFLGPTWMQPPLLSIVLLRWLLFRVEFGAGLIKLRGDSCWRNLTCLDYHHETQPLPGPFSWHFHRLPRLVHRVEVVGNHVAQLVAPVLILLPQPAASVGGALVIVTQLWLIASGNFSWLNWLTIVLAVSAFSDPVLGAVLPLSAPDLAAPPLWLHVLVVVLTLAVAVMSWRPVRNMASPNQAMNVTYNPLRLVGSYGAFGAVTRERHEVILEGTDAETPSDDADWHEYDFKAKPGDPARRPPLIAPYHLRLDWVVWFAAMSPPSVHPWLVGLLAKLLQGDEDTRRLLRRDPFGDEPPRYVRARLYRYEFTSRAERRRTGNWWARTLLGEYLSPVALDQRGEVRAWR